VSGADQRVTAELTQLVNGLSGELETPFTYLVSGEFPRILVAQHAVKRERMALLGSRGMCRVTHCAAGYTDIRNVPIKYVDAAMIEREEGTIV
jgi:hypothetical protein